MLVVSTFFGYGIKEARNIKVGKTPKNSVKNKTVKEFRHQGKSKKPYCKTKQSRRCSY
jgi:hypothetical protein